MQLPSQLRERRTKVILLITALVSASILTAIFYPYPSPPDVRVTPNCLTKLNLVERTPLHLLLRNSGESTAQVTLCLYSSEFMFKEKAGQLTNEKCFPEEEVRPEGPKTGPAYHFVNVIPDTTRTKKVDRAFIRIELDCEQPAWPVSFDCKHLSYTCVYLKSEKAFHLQKIVY